MKFAWIEEHHDDWPIEEQCRVLGVSRAGYYAWRDREPSDRQRRREELATRILQVHLESRRTYGSPRVFAELADRGVKVCENTVAGIMRKEGISSKMKKKHRVRTTDSNHAHPVAENVLDRCFEQTSPDRVWATDITYIETDEGWLYLAGVIDLCTRKIVGWAMADHMKTELCIDALNMALTRRRPGVGLLHHSDRGVQYTCPEYQDLLKEHGLESSMSGVGDCWDNALMESFWGTLKTELVYHEHYATREQARISLFEYIECWYNRRRRHSAIGYKSPDEFEASLN